MFWHRVMTALLLLPLVIGLVFWLPLHSFTMVVGVILCIAAWEWSLLAGAKNKQVRWAFVLLTALLQIVIVWLSPPVLFWPTLSWPVFTGELSMTIVWSSVGFWALSPVLVYFYPEKIRWWRSSSFIRFALGLLLILSTWIALVSLRRIGILDEPYKGSFIILFVLLLVWAADTGAYIAGKTFGKHKMAPKVSPGKTWQGFIGGLLLAMFIAWFGSDVLGISVQNKALLMFAAFLTVIVSVLGDLVESLAKREANVKDSGSIFPGHGGMLDRIDSLMAAAPVFCVFALLLELH